MTRHAHTAPRSFRSRITKRATVITGASLLALGGIAAAALLVTGSGTGSGLIVAGTVGGGTGNPLPTNGIVRLSVDPLNVTGGFTPGGTPATINLDVTNPNDNAVLITTVTFGGVSSPNGACQAMIASNPSQFLQVPNSVTENTTVPANTPNFALPVPTTLTWVSVPTLDQSPCSGQPLGADREHSVSSRVASSAAASGHLVLPLARSRRRCYTGRRPTKGVPMTMKKMLVLVEALVPGSDGRSTLRIPSTRSTCRSTHRPTADWRPSTRSSFRCTPTTRCPATSRIPTRGCPASSRIPTRGCRPSASHPIYLPVQPPDGSDLRPEQPIYWPVYPDIGLPGDQPHPEHPIVLPPQIEDGLTDEQKEKLIGFLFGNLPPFSGGPPIATPV